ncbi:MAG TPA: hypothetical protein PKZ56_01015 [Candidatus Paceibacterota bacterium]|nr:hypothetical protein [Candidatus Paceibacterota bacterium]
MTLSPKTHSMVHIVGLAVVTFILAGLALLLFPRFSNAPKPDESNPAITELTTKESSVVFDNFGSHARIVPKQIIEGKAPGYWFFEGSFPVTLQDINGNTFAIVTATTEADWMVTEHVQFSVTMPEPFSYTGVGSILFKKDDPSDGEAPFDPDKDQLVVPVIFKNEE